MISGLVDDVLESEDVGIQTDFIEVLGCWDQQQANEFLSYLT